jgi:CheY-like chemotaxis protein
MHDQASELDGIELTHRVRAFAALPTFIIMLTSTSTPAEVEKYYCAGVDHCVSKTNFEQSLTLGVLAAFKAIGLRRSKRQGLGDQEVVTIDLASGAHTARHLIGRLSAEIMLARRQASTLDIVMLGVDAPDPGEPATNGAVSDEQLRALLAAIQGAYRAGTDWVVWLHAIGQTHRFAIVIPGTTFALAGFEQNISNAFVGADSNISSRARAPRLTFSFASYRGAPDAAPPTAMELLRSARQARAE